MLHIRYKKNNLKFFYVHVFKITREHFDDNVLLSFFIVCMHVCMYVVCMYECVCVCVRAYDIVKMFQQFLVKFKNYRWEKITLTLIYKSANCTL